MACHVFPAATCLMTKLVDTLLALSPEELAEQTVVLPTQRLCTWLLAAIAKQRGAFIPPTCVTFEQFLAMLAPVPGSVLRPQTLQLYVASQLEKAPAKKLDRHHGREVAALYEEFHDADLPLDAFSALQQRFAEDVYLHERKLGHYTELVQELADFFQRLDGDMSRQGFQSKAAWRRKMALQARKVLETWDRPLFMVGFTTFSKVYRETAVILGNRPTATLWFNGPQQRHGQTPLAQLLADLDLPQSLPARAPPGVTVWEAATLVEECAVCLGLVRQALQAGYAPAQVAIVLPDEELYGNLVRTALAAEPESFPEANIPLKITVGGTVAGHWVRLMMTALQGNWSLQDAKSLLLHPLSQRLLPLPETGKASLGNAIRSLLEGTGQDGLNGMLRDFMQRWLPTGGSFDELLQGCERLLTEVRTHGGFPAELSKALEESTDHYLADLRLVPESIDTSASPRGQLSAVLEGWLACELRTIGEPLQGIQVLGLAEIRNMPFSYVVLMGCFDGAFPKALPQDDLLEDGMKRTLGLSGWANLEAMEDLNFTLLCQRLPVLQLTRPKTVFDQDTISSRFLDLLRIDGGLHHGDVDALLALTQSVPPPAGAKVPDAPSSGQLEGCWTGRQAMGSISVSEVEVLIKCPFRFLLQRLGLRSDHLWQDRTAAREGEWLHAVLEHFSKEAGAATPSDCRESQLERLLALTREHGPKGVTSTMLYYHLQHHAWPKYVAFLGALVNTAKVARSERELPFDVSLDNGNSMVSQTFRQLRGSIDAIEKLPEQDVIFDFKRKHTPTKADVRQGLAPQLLLYRWAYGQQVAGSKAVQVGYWNILEGKWTPIATDGNWLGEKLLSLPQMLERVWALWSWRVNTVQHQQRFMADPSDCGFCRFNGICRKDDPQHVDRFEQQRELMQRISQYD